MDQVSVTVRIPALGITSDFIIPNNMSVENVKTLMLRILSSEYGISEDPNQLQLFDTQDGGMLRKECSFRQMEIQDGAKLILL